MKKPICLIVSGLLVLSLAACASTGTKESNKVKCPACKYEFKPPAEGN